MRNHRKTIVAILLAAGLAGSAIAATENASNSPFDFSYRVTGASELRPAIVFNDAKDTYIELNADVKVTVPGGAEAFRQGPYYVIRGLKNEITLSAKGKRASILYEPAPTLASMTDPIDLMPVTPAPVAQAVVTAAPVEAPNSDAIRQAVEERIAKCVSRPVRSESALLVEFASKNASLSTVSRAKLEQAGAKYSSTVDSVNVRLPSEDEDSALGKKRALHIADAIVKAGIPRSAIHADFGNTYGGMTEVTFVSTARMPCGDKDLVVSGNAGALTVMATEADAKTILKRISSAANKQFRIEGTAREVPVSVSAAAEPLTRVLAKIGSAVDQYADVLLRDNELVLRFN